MNNGERTLQKKKILAGLFTAVLAVFFLLYVISLLQFIGFYVFSINFSVVVPVFAIITFLFGLYIERLPNSADFNSLRILSHITATMTVPPAFFIILLHTGLHLTGLTLIALAVFLMLDVYIAGFLLTKKSYYTGMIIFLSSWLFITVVNLIIGGSLFLKPDTVNYAVFYTLGIVYISLAYYFPLSNHRGLKAWFLGGGVFLFLATPYIFGNLSSTRNVPLLAVYFLTLGAIFYWSRDFYSRTLLVVGSLFTSVFIFTLFMTYLWSRLSWPVFLVSLGIVLLLLSYFMNFFNKKFLSEQL